MRHESGKAQDLREGELMSKIIMWVSIVAVIALGILNLTFSFGVEPDEVYTMANQRITWRYAGK